MKRRSAFVILSVYLILMLCACGRTDADDSGQTFLSGDEAQVSVADSSEEAKAFESVTDESDENYTYEGIEVWSESHGGNGLWSLMTSESYHNPALYNRDEIVHSETGRQLAEAIIFSESYQGINDPALPETLSAMGLDFAVNTTDGTQWLLFAPKEPKDSEVPVVQVFTPTSLYGMSMYYKMIEMAGKGEFILVLLGIEDGNKVSLVPEIVDQLAVNYPIDTGRVYSVGHSHYGAFSQQLAERYPEKIAGIAQLSGYFGCMNGASESWHNMDMPVFGAIGSAEMNSPVPLNTDAPAIEAIPERYQRIFPMSRDDRIKSWQDRLYELNCGEISKDKIEAASDGSDVERVLGFPVTEDQVIRAYGLNYYVGDLTNIDGNHHARFAVIQNFPHSISPYELELTWDFLKRFARDTETGECVELYSYDGIGTCMESKKETEEYQAEFSWHTESLDVVKRDQTATIQGELFLPDREGKIPLIIFSHEFLQTHTSGTPYGEYFAARGIAVYTFDFINGAGNGRSDFTKVSGMTEAEDLEDVFVASKEWDFVDTEKIVLIGASFGCFPTAVCGINHQDEVAGMILLYPGLRFLEDIEAFDDVNDVPETWDFHGITLGRNYVTDLWGYDIYEEMAKYSGKVLVLNGDNDQAISVEFARNVADSFPDAEFKVIANGSHGFTGTALDDALECISDYLSQVIRP